MEGGDGVVLHFFSCLHLVFADMNGPRSPHEAGKKGMPFLRERKANERKKETKKICLVCFPLMYLVDKTKRQCSLLWVKTCVSVFLVKIYAKAVLRRK